MSVQTVAGKFMELCNQGKHFEVMRTMYAPEMVSVEGDGKETVGQQPVIRKSEIWRKPHHPRRNAPWAVLLRRPQGELRPVRCLPYPRRPP
jgi:hypothetical protein